MTHKDGESTGTQRSPDAWWGTESHELEARAPDAPDTDGRSTTFLTPTLRFLVGALLCLDDDPHGRLDPAHGGTSDYFPKLKPEDFTSRRSLIDATQDPLDRVVGGLGVRRFVTTNYDFEIERHFMNRGFRRFPRHEPTRPREGMPPPETHDFRSDAIGGVLRDESFRREDASQLVTFAIGDQRDEAAVFHLHGRATKEDALVVTERDYMNLYLWEDGWRDTVNEGITMAFSSGPLLFLGLGMTEGDMLRPLRQFMSNRDRTVGYQAIALLPAEKARHERTQLTSSLYLRYGVHTIFYGGGTITMARRGKQDTGERSLDWLHRIMQIITVLTDHVTGVEKDLKSAKSVERKRKDLLHTLITTLGTVGDDLNGYKTRRILKTDLRPLALAVMLGDDTVYGVKLKRWDTLLQNELLRVCSFTQVRQNKDNENTRHHDPGTNVDGDAYVGGPTRLLGAILKSLLQDDRTWTAADQKELAALRIMLNGLRGAFLTGSLNAALDGLHLGWESWWKHWQDSPPHRVAQFEQLEKWKGEGQGLPGPVRYIRHPVDDPLGLLRDSWDKPVTDVSYSPSLGQYLA